MADPNQALDTLAERYWEDQLAQSPISATAIGRREFDALLPEESPMDRAQKKTDRQHRLAEARGLANQGLTPEREITRRELIATLERQIDTLDCQAAEYLVSPMSGPHLRITRLPQIQSLRTASEAESYAERIRAAASYLEQHRSNLEKGLSEGRVSASKAIQRVSRQLVQLLTLPTPQWPLAKHASDYSKGLGNEVVQDLDQGVRPSLARLLSFLLGELLPRARSDDQPGLCFLKGGEADYVRCIHAQTSLKKDPQAIHDLGLEEVSRLHSVILPLAERTLGTRNLTELRAALAHSPELHFQDEDDVLEKARVAVERGTKALKTITHLDPGSICQVLPIPPMEAPDAPLGYYRSPSRDGSRPGTYFVNTHAPTTKLSIDAEGVAYHEAVPGHHLQIAIAQRLDLPEFRRFETLSAYAEGWALYSEKLSDELGLYSRDLDRLGMLCQDLWRAARLVLDTGLHALGWSRQAAIDFAQRETLMPEGGIENEIDRFVVMPGQALGYKLGEFEILKLRRAWDQDAATYSLADFHDAVLGQGGLSLETLAEIAGPPSSPKESNR